MIEMFDEVVYNMMQEFGTYAFLSVTTKEEYDPEISENIVTKVDYKVKVCVFDYLDKSSGIGTENGSLVQTGDKQVFIQPPHKLETGIPLPHILPNRDTLKIADKVYKIIALKEYNPSASRQGSVLYEAYVRE